MTPQCIIIASAGKKGHERQAVAVAQRLGCALTVIEANKAAARRVLAADADLVLAAGRQSIAPARQVARGRAPGSRPLVGVLQPVVWRPGQFDLVWAPAHDRVPMLGQAPANLVRTLTAPCAVTRAAMDAAAAQLDAAGVLPGAPHVGVLVGGPSRAHRFGRAEGTEFVGRLHAFAAANGVRLLLTTSRRTPKAVTRQLRERLGNDHFVYDASTGRAGPHALDAATVYAAILGASEAFVATNDSFAMLSEAAFTGKPVYGWRLPGGKAKFERFYRGLEAHGALRWFDGSLERWTYPPLDSARRIADALAPLLGLASEEERRI